MSGNRDWIRWENGHHTYFHGILPRLYLASQLHGGSIGGHCVFLNKNNNGNNAILNLQTGIRHRNNTAPSMLQALTYSIIKELELSTNREISSIHSGNITCMALDSIEGRFLLTGGIDGQISCIDLSSLDSTNVINNNNSLRAELLRRGRVYGRASLVSSLEWFPNDSGCFLSSDYGGNVSLWDTNEFKIAFTFDISNKQNKNQAVQSKVICSRMQNINSNGMLIGCGLSDSSVKLCDVRTGDSCLTIRAHSQSLSCLQWHPQNSYEVSTSSYDGTVKTWDIRRVGGITLFSTGYGGTESHQPLLSFDWRGDHTMKATIDPDPWYDCSTSGTTDQSQNKRFKISNDKLALSKAYDGSVMAMAYTSDGNYIVTSGTHKSASSNTQHTIRLWDSSTGKLKSNNYEMSINKHHHAVNTSKLPYEMCIASFNSGGDDLLVYPLGDNGDVSIVPIHSNGKPLKILKGHLSNVNSVIYRGNEFNQFITAAKDGMIYVWERDSSLSTIPSQNYHISSSASSHRSAEISTLRRSVQPGNHDISHTGLANSDYWSDVEV
jgi:DNA excision repair protein ERCC-8